jgi:thiosulfate/3-mercaptopyruvate sulfurtransferase
MSKYVHPEVLVSTEWLAEHLTDPQVRAVEVDVDTAAYEAGHIPGAVAWSWKTDLVFRWNVPLAAMLHRSNQI